jgi:hypothetical protein
MGSGIIFSALPGWARLEAVRDSLARFGSDPVSESLERAKPLYGLGWPAIRWAALNVILANTKPEYGLAGVISDSHLPLGIGSDLFECVAGQVGADRHRFLVRGILALAIGDDIAIRCVMTRHMK